MRGTRLRAADVPGLVAAGASKDEILADHPFPEAADLRVVLLYAARQADHMTLDAAGE